tara:strand:- start:407 stop:541 length:135 start_codon:yes stop_codon:yes gene_type:complete
LAGSTEKVRIELLIGVTKDLCESVFNLIQSILGRPEVMDVIPHP